MVQLLSRLQIEVALGKKYFERALTNVNLLILWRSSLYTEAYSKAEPSLLHTLKEAVSLCRGGHCSLQLSDVLFALKRTVQVAEERLTFHIVF